MTSYKTLLIVLLTCCTIFGHAQNIDGMWQGKLGSMDLIISFKTEGKKIFGFVSTTGNDQIIMNGKISGSALSFAAFAGTVQNLYKGNILGDSISLVATMNSREFTGGVKRVDPSLPTPFLMKHQMTEFYETVPKVVTPGTGAGLMTPPSDAKVLFDGKDLLKWKSSNGGEAKWDVHDEVFTVKKGTGDIETKDSFGDYQLHIEWQVPADIQGQSQARGNSGIFMQGIYELQVMDSYNNKTYTNGQAGSIYKQTTPLVNAMRKPGEWNVYDVIYVAPRFKDDGNVLYSARITVLHNGVLILNNFEIRGTTPYIGFPKYTAHGKGPIRLQDHGDPSKPISFRNIWIREL